MRLNPKRISVKLYRSQRRMKQYVTNKFFRDKLTWTSWSLLTCKQFSCNIRIKRAALHSETSSGLLVHQRQVTGNTKGQVCKGPILRQDQTFVAEGQNLTFKPSTREPEVFCHYYRPTWSLPKHTSKYMTSLYRHCMYGNAYCISSEGVRSGDLQFQKFVWQQTVIPAL
jgi:hypothetical protein